MSSLETGIPVKYTCFFLSYSTKLRNFATSNLKTT